MVNSCLANLTSSAKKLITMKNNDLDELKPIYIHEVNYSSSNEVSLFDLIMVLTNRKKLIGIICISVLLLAVAKTILTPKKYTYSTSLEIGSQIIDGKVQTFESPETLLAKLQFNFIPKALSSHKINQNDNKTYAIKATNPKNSTIVILKTTGVEAESDTIRKILQEITQKAVIDNKKMYSAIKQNLDIQIERTKLELDVLDTTKENADEKERLLKSDLRVSEASLANLQSTREIMEPMKSTKPVGVSRKIVVVSATIVGLFIGIFAAFMVEFISKIRERTEKDRIIKHEPI